MTAIDPAAPPAIPAEAAPVLVKSLRARHVEMIAIGGIIGAGLFVGSSAAIAAAGPAVIISYLIAGLIVVLVMRMLTELAVAIPGVQSFPEFTRFALGNWAGFISGWLYWYFWVVVVAIEAIAGANIVHLWLPAVPPWEIGLALLTVLTGVNLLSTRTYGEFEFWFSSIKVAAILVFILVAFLFAVGVTAPNGPTFANLTAHAGFMAKGPLSVLGAVTSVLFSLVGAEIATIAAAEAAGSEKTIARMTGTVIVRILIFYVFSVGLIVAVVPWTSIVPGESPFSKALATMAIPGGAAIMNMIVLVAVLSCLNSGLYVTSRVLFSLAAKGDAPQALVKLDSRRVPTRAILFGSLFSYAALALSVLSPEKIFAFLVNASGTIMLVIYLLIALSQLRLRKQLEAEAKGRLSVTMWWHPWGGLAAISAIIAVLLAMAFTETLASQFYASLAAVGAAAAGFWLTRSRNSAARA